MPSHRLLDDRLRTQGVAEVQIAQMQSWSDRLANLCMMTPEESRHYHSLDFEDWVATLTPDFLVRHHLPADLHLYDEFHFLTWISARRSLIAQRLQGIYHLAPSTADAAREDDDDLTPADEVI